jgi:hypothetical protein
MECGGAKKLEIPLVPLAGLFARSGLVLLKLRLSVTSEEVSLLQPAFVGDNCFLKL